MPPAVPVALVPPVPPLAVAPAVFAAPALLLGLPAALEPSPLDELHASGASNANKHPLQRLRVVRICMSSSTMQWPSQPQNRILFSSTASANCAGLRSLGAISAELALSERAQSRVECVVRSLRRVSSSAQASLCTENKIMFELEDDLLEASHGDALWRRLTINSHRRDSCCA